MSRRTVDAAAGVFLGLVAFTCWSRFLGWLSRTPEPEPELPAPAPADGVLAEIAVTAEGEIIRRGPAVADVRWCGASFRHGPHEYDDDDLAPRTDGGKWACHGWAIAPAVGMGGPL